MGATMGTVERRLLGVGSKERSLVDGRVLLKEKREAMAWRCLIFDLGVSCGAGMALSGLLRVVGLGLFECADLANRSTAIIEQAIFLKAEAHGAALRSRISMMAQTSLWLSRISLPSCLSSRPWKRRPKPDRRSSSFLLRQNEKLI